MATREQCIRAIASALGREPTQAQLRNIEQRIRAAQLRLARTDTARWRTLSEPERLIEAGKEAAQELLAEASKKVQRAELAVLAADRTMRYREQQIAEGSDADGVSAIDRMVTHNYDEKNGGMISLEERADAGFDLAYTQVSEVFDELNPGFLRRLYDKVVHGEPVSRAHLRRMLTDALHGITDGIPSEVVQWASRYHEVVEALREQFNAAGGVIGKLEDWGSAHSWSGRRLEEAYDGYAADARQRALLRATGQHKAAGRLDIQMREKARDEFVNDMLTHANRDRYIKEDGARYTEAELREFFEEAWGTIVSDGWTKDPVIVGDGSRPPGGAVKANRGSYHRVIHLKPEAAFAMLSKYSEQNILESMIGSLRRMSRDIAAVEMFGPNPDYMIQQQLDDAVREGARIDERKAGALEAHAERVKNTYDYLVGNNPRPMDRRIHDAFATLRNIQVWKLGGAAITSLTDMESMYKTALQNRLNPVKVMLNSTLAWAPRSRRYARRLGLVIDTMVSDLERISGENISARSLSAKTASGVIRASGLSFVTTARRMGFAMTMMDSIGHLTRQAAYADVSALHESDYAMLAAKGIDQATWDIWRAADVETWGANHSILSPDAIMRVSDDVIETVRQRMDNSMTPEQRRMSAVDMKREAAIRLLSIVRSEQDIAIITPGAKQRTMMRTFFGAARSGSWGGELARSVFVFKSFAITLQQRNWQRSGFYSSGLGRYGYMAQMIVTMAALGAVANWVKDLLQGKDPRLMWGGRNDKERSIITRNWIQAGLSGGGLGIYGDFLFAETSPGSQTSAIETMAGPVLATGASAVNITVGNATEALAGEDTEFGADAVRFARGNVPFANLPYVRAIADRAIWYELMDWTDPGAVDRMVDRQRSRQATTYWLDPNRPAWESVARGDVEAPDFERAVGAD